MTPAEETAFTRRLDDYMTARDLQFDGAPLRFVVRSPDRSLTSSDQVDLLDWLTDDPALCTAMVSPLVRRLDQPADRDDGYLPVHATDTALIGLTPLYRARRVSAEQYIAILGGFIRPAVTRSTSN
jgi:hypothetical protein